MNNERLEQMAEWLEDGAPHVVFGMHTGNEPVDEVLKELNLEKAVLLGMLYWHSAPRTRRVSTTTYAADLYKV